MAVGDGRLSRLAGLPDHEQEHAAAEHAEPAEEHDRQQQEPEQRAFHVSHATPSWSRSSCGLAAYAGVPRRSGAFPAARTASQSANTRRPELEPAGAGLAITTT